MRKRALILLAILVISQLIVLMPKHSERRIEIPKIKQKLPESNPITERPKYGLFAPTKVPKLKYEKVTIQQTSRKWTFMVYLDGDNNLEYFSIQDFFEMANVGSTDEVAIVVLYDRCVEDNESNYYSAAYGNWTDAKYFYITYGMKPIPDNATQDLGEVNMGDPQTLVNFTLWAMQNYPAEHYALVIWDHGGGVIGVAWDEDNYNDYLTLSELRAALEAIYNATGRKLDLLGFDACLMGLAEVAYELAFYVDVVVFSQETEPGYGWPYDLILENLTSNPYMGPAELAKVIVDSYIYYYTGIDTSATLSAVNTTEFLMNAVPAINRFVGEVLRNFEAYNDSIVLAMQNAESFYYSEQKDIINFLQLLASYEPEISTLCLDVTAAINSSIIANGKLSGHPNANGISIILDDYYYWLSDYETILMSKHQQWVEFLKKLNGYEPDLWLYDASITGGDSDNDGYYDNAYLVLDLDSYTSETVYVNVTVSGDFVYMFSAGPFNITRNSSSDAIQIPLNVSTKGHYNLMVVVYGYGSTREFYFFFDKDAINVPLEPWLTGYPVLSIVEPKSNSVLYGVVKLAVSAEDETAVVSVNATVCGEVIQLTYNSTSGLYEGLLNTTSLPDGSVEILFSASDGENVTKILANYTIDNIIINLVSPVSGSRSYKVLKVEGTAVHRAGVPFSNAEVIISNGTEYQFALPIGPSGNFSGAILLTSFSPGWYSVTVVIISSAGGYDSLTVTVFLSERQAPILVVDDDAGANYEDHYIEALKALGFEEGIDFEVTASSEVTADVLLCRKVVIWFTGNDCDDVLNSQEREAITKYLDSGGALFFSSQDAGYYLVESGCDPAWYQKYLRAVYYADSVPASYVVFVSEPLQGINVSLYGSDSAGNALYPSNISAFNGSWVLGIYDGNASMVGAIAYAGEYRLVYFAFPFEAINGSSVRKNVMESILRWLLNDTVIFRIKSPRSGSFHGYVDLELLMFPATNIEMLDVLLNGTLYKSFEPTNMVRVIPDSSGVYNITVIAYLASGEKVSDSVVLEIKADTSPPQVEIVSPASAYVNSTMVTIAWTWWDDSGIDRFEVRVDGRLYVTTATSITLELAEGKHTVEITAYDIVGKTNQDGAEFIVDVTKPSITILSPDEGQTFWGVVKISAYAEDNFKLEEVQVYVDGELIAVSKDGSVSVTVDLDSGEHKLVIVALDAAGNIARAERSFIVKKVPVLPIGVASIVAIIAFIWFRKRLSLTRHSRYASSSLGH